MNISASVSIWVVFHLVVVLALGVDLLWLQRRPHGISSREAFGWTGFWTGVAALAAVYIYGKWGGGKAVDFAASYLLELSLSMDNVFVFYLIFRAFNINKLYHHKILFWGIIGAFVMRALMIFGGIKLLNTVHWTSYVLGGILIISGLKILQGKTKEGGLEVPAGIRLLKRLLPIKDQHEGGKFFVKEPGRSWQITPVFVALLSVEFADLVFAVDSVPAVLAITEDFFIVYTSNILAILGLRSLYVILSHGADFLPYLHQGLALVLVFVGAKFMLASVVTISTLLSLGVIVGIIAVSVGLSLIKPVAKGKDEK